MSWDGKDRRGAKRYGIKNSTVVFRRGDWLAFLAPPSPTYLLLNVGMTGCHFICKEDLAVGSSLRLSIEIPHHKGTIRARGAVIWTRRSSDQTAFHVGVRFTGLGSRSRGLLKNVLDGAIL